MSSKLLKDALRKRSATGPTPVRSRSSATERRRQLTTATAVPEKAAHQRTTRKAVKREAAAQKVRKHTDHTRTNVRFLRKAAATEKSAGLLSQFSN